MNRANIIIRRIRDNHTEAVVEVSSLDEQTVRTRLNELKAQYPSDIYRIDLSQVYWARKAATERAAA